MSAPKEEPTAPNEGHGKNNEGNNDPPKMNRQRDNGRHPQQIPNRILDSARTVSFDGPFERGESWNFHDSATEGTRHAEPCIDFP